MLQLPANATLTPPIFHKRSPDRAAATFSCMKQKNVEKLLDNQYNFKFSRLSSA